jgi:NitT/TauT family transport system permease protein
MAHEKQVMATSELETRPIENTAVDKTAAETSVQELPALADVATGDIVTGATTMRRAPRVDGVSSLRSQSSDERVTAGHTAQRRTAEKRAARRAWWSDVALRTTFLALLVVLWHVLHYILVTRTDLWSGALFPAPKQVVLWLWDRFGFSYLTGTYRPPPGEDMPPHFWAALRQADYLPAIGTSIGRLMEGYLIATLIGFPLGLMVARWALAEKTVGWIAISLQSLPSICWIPLALLWFGRVSVTAPILFVTVMGSLFATVIAVADGIRNVPPLLSRAGRTLGATGPRLYFSILLPAALPSIVTGLKIGWSFAWRSLMAAELLVNKGGLGFLLQRYGDYEERMDGVLATILVIILIGLGVQSLVFAPIERRLQALWGLSGVRS